MDKDYIERRTLLVNLKEFHDYVMQDREANPAVQWYEVMFYEKAKSFLENAPAADAVAVKHGRWVKHIRDELHLVYCDKCSVCSFEVDDLIDANRDGYNYCPNCGAKMDGE